MKQRLLTILVVFGLCTVANAAQLPDNDAAMARLDDEVTLYSYGYDVPTVENLSSHELRTTAALATKFAASCTLTEFTEFMNASDAQKDVILNNYRIEQSAAYMPTTASKQEHEQPNYNDAQEAYTPGKPFSH